MAKSAYRTTVETLSSGTIETYQQQGFVHLPSVLTAAEVDEFRVRALDVEQRLKEKALHYKNPVFTQLVNVWREDEIMRKLTLHSNIAGLAERLAGVSLRLWHDQILIKQPHISTPTEFHQDQPYWPHVNSTHALTAWIALVDVPVERGCMTFLPETYTQMELAAQDLTDKDDLFRKGPELMWSPRVTIPLRAGDCTFHHARTAHMANANTTDLPRVAHAIIYMDATTIYKQQRHIVTDPLQLEEGKLITGELFPIAASMHTY